MHDLILAKQISDLVKHLSAKHEFKTVQKVSIEVGDVSNLHKHHEHEEHHHGDIKVSNLKFHLNNFYPSVKFQVRRKKIEGWKLKEIEGE